MTRSVICDSTFRCYWVVVGITSAWLTHVCVVRTLQADWVWTQSRVTQILGVTRTSIRAGIWYLVSSARPWLPAPRPTQTRGNHQWYHLWGTELQNHKLCKDSTQQFATNYCIKVKNTSCLIFLGSCPLLVVPKNNFCRKIIMKWQWQWKNKWANFK